MSGKHQRLNPNLHTPEYWNQLREQFRKCSYPTAHACTPHEVEHLKTGIEILRTEIHVTEVVYHRWKEDALKKEDEVES